MSNTINLPLMHSVSITQKVVPIIHALQSIIEHSQLPLNLEIKAVEKKLTQKVRNQLSEHYNQPLFIIDDKLQLFLLTDQISVSPDWKTLQRRVVSAGRKSELLLQACKLTDKSYVLDATAGFGHDSLILASTGAQVVMLERDPFMALLLMYQKQLMAQQKNWQKLMARLKILWGNSIGFMSSETFNSETLMGSNFDVIYLDPMFPENSYQNNVTGKGAKVGKHMQALHQIASPPNLDEEKKLLTLALDKVVSGGRVVVKRPAAAPLFSGTEPSESWHNDVLRFDAYFKTVESF